jgi:hypothetical protein
MKTNKLYSFILLLICLSIGLSAQDMTRTTNEPVGSDQPNLTLDSQCKAEYSVILDSLSTNPFLYHFEDLSTGNINSWHWDFGDGRSSTEQNPSHQYDAAGTYNICLTVADQNDTSLCFDRVCHDVITMEYFSLGGLVYAGEYPLNNPVMAGDTGIASLYRIVNDQIVFVEDQYFIEYGYYWFGYLFPGDYMVKIALSEGSTHYEDYFTTYYGDKISWTKAELLSISTSDLYESEIHLMPVQEMITGTGTIRGYVKFEQDHIFSMPPMAQTTVILADKDHLPLLFTHPNNAGYFEFSSIPFDSYYLSADATGKSASTVNVILTEDMPLVEGINLTIFGSNANYIDEGYANGISLTRIFPNPVSDNLNISFYSGISSPASIKIIDITGKVSYNQSGTFETGLNEIRIPVKDLPDGVHLLIIQTMGNHLPVTAKFVK